MSPFPPVTSVALKCGGSLQAADVQMWGERYGTTSDELPSMDRLDASQITLTGELNKLANNIAQARNIAGLHWRSDATQAILLGEAVAISILRDQKHTYNETFPGFTFTRFDGTTLTI